MVIKDIFLLKNVFLYTPTVFSLKLEFLTRTKLCLATEISKDIECRSEYVNPKISQTPIWIYPLYSRMKTCENLDWLSFLLTFSMNFYWKVKHELDHSLRQDKPVNALLLLWLLALPSYWASWTFLFSSNFWSQMTFSLLWNSKGNHAEWLWDWQGFQDIWRGYWCPVTWMISLDGQNFHHINLTLKVRSHCTRISSEIF